MISRSPASSALILSLLAIECYSSRVDPFGGGAISETANNLQGTSAILDGSIRGSLLLEGNPAPQLPAGGAYKYTLEQDPDPSRADNENEPGQRDTWRRGFGDATRVFETGTDLLERRAWSI